MRLAALVLVGCGAKPAPPAAPPLADTGCTDNLRIAPGGMLVVDGSWRGKPVVVLLDTGAMMGSVSESFATRNGLKRIGTLPRTGAAGETKEHFAYDAGTVRVGGAEVDGSILVGFEFESDQYDFRIGPVQLRDHVMDIDVRSKSFCLTRSPHTLATQPLQVFGTRQTGMTLIIPAKLGAFEAKDMVLDTGAAMTVLRSDLVAKIDHTVVREEDMVDSTGVMFKTTVSRVPEICFGGTCVREQQVASSPALDKSHGDTDGLLGVPLFAEYRLVVDIPARRFGLVK
jgi:hypothetical protein